MEWCSVHTSTYYCIIDFFSVLSFSHECIHYNHKFLDLAVPQLQIIEQDWSSTTAQEQYGMAREQYGMEPRLRGLLRGMLSFMYFLRFE